MNFAVLVDDWVKNKENKNSDIYFELAKVVKKQRNLKVTV